MANTYTLSIRIRSYDFSGEFYFVGNRYDTGKKVLKHVVTDQFI